MIGLDDVIAAETMLSHVDGAAGRLILRGHDVESLSGKVSFEAAVRLLWDGIVELSADCDLGHAIGLGRQKAFAHFEPLLAAVQHMTPFEGSRFLLSSISDADELAQPAALLGACGVATAVAIRASNGAGAIEPDPALGHAGDILRMITGTVPSPQETLALDSYLVTIMDHGLNASTFAARVVASTQAGTVSASLAALCALKGPLHGGAPGPVLDMLDAIGASERAEPWLNAALDRGERLMGFGHRIYRTRDPRADALKAALSRVSAGSKRLALAESVEAAALKVLSERKAARKLDVNVEFYTALLLDALHISREGFTAVFAVGRMAGWIAHIYEQEASGRLIRPQSRYIGEIPVRAA